MRTLAAALIVVALFGCGSKPQPELFICVWADYLPDDTVKAFEKEQNCRLVVAYFSSSDQIKNAVVGGQGGYDLVWPSDDLMPMLVAAGGLEPIDESKLPNLKNLAERWRKDVKYGVPYSWGTTGIAVDTEKIAGKIDSWAALWDPKYKPISMLDDAREAFAAALRLAGKSGNTTEPEAVEAAKKKLIDQKQHLLPYDSSPKTKLLAKGVSLCQCFSGDALQAANEGAKIAYVIPKEGGTLWADFMSIPKGAKNRELAHRFIDYILRPEVAAHITNDKGYATPNEAARAKIDAELLRNPIVFPSDDDLKRCERLTDIGKARQAIEDGWAEVRRK